MAENPQLNDSGTAGEPSVNASTNTGPVQTNDSTKGDKARVNTDAFLLSLGLDPKDGWKVSGLPTQKTTTQGAATVNVPGQYVVTISGPKGESRTATLVPQGGDAAIAGKPLDQVDWTVTGVDQNVAPATKTPGETDAAIAASQAQVEQAKAAAAKSAADLATVQNDNAMRAKNQQARGLYMTDKEIADMDAQLKSQGLQQAQIDAQLKIASDNNRNSATSNEIAATNAATNAKVAEHNAIIDDARVKLGQDQLTLDQAKQVFTEQQANITNVQADRKITLDELTQRQANEVAQQQVASGQQTNVLRGQEAAETGRHNVATEAQAAATAQQQAQTAALTGAADIYKTAATGTQQAAQTGAGLLNQRVSSATGALSNILGQAAGSKMLSAPAGLGAGLTGGLQEWVTGLGGGQPVYDAAAAMVNAANPNIGQNQELQQQAYTALRGMLDLYKAQTGQPHPAEVQAAQAGAAQAGQPVTAANTVGQSAQTTPVQTNTGVDQQLQQTQQANAAATGITAPNTAALNARGLMDNAQGRAMAVGQTPVTTPPVYPGQYNTAYQQGVVSPVGQPATGVVVGGNTGAPWGIPTLPIPQPLQFRAPVTV